MATILTTLVILHVNYLPISISYSKWIADCYIEGIKKDSFVLSKQLLSNCLEIFWKKKTPHASIIKLNAAFMMDSMITIHAKNKYLFHISKIEK